MIVDLIRTETDDGISTVGALYPPRAEPPKDLAVDSILLIHGSGTNFYAPHGAAMAEDLSAAGIPSLSFNTRGHDIIWRDPENGGYYGNAYEILHDCNIDLKAGMDYLWSQGYRRIGILGHSMGAVKVAYYAATARDSRVQVVVPISPVRLSYSYYMESVDRDEFAGIIDLARSLEEQGKGDQVFKVDFPIPHAFGASSYLDKHGSDERYNLVQLAPNIDIPMLVLGGTLETHTRLLDICTDLAGAAANSPQADCVLIEGGTHSLTNKREEAAKAVVDWLASVRVPSSQAAD